MHSQDNKYLIYNNRRCTLKYCISYSPLFLPYYIMAYPFTMLYIFSWNCMVNVELYTFTIRHCINRHEFLISSEGTM